jgi:recombination protein RecA
MAKEKVETTEPIDKKQAAKKALFALNKKFGPGTVVKYSEWGAGKDIEYIPSGSIALDHALGGFGYPRGRIIEITGYEASGKTLTTLHALAECQRLGGTVAFVDAEHALSVERATLVGVNMGDVVLSQPDNGEQALTVVEELVKSGAFDMIVVDSVAALVPQKELEDDMGTAQMGLHARLMSQAMRKLTAVVHKSKCVLFFINQYRQKIGVMYGPSETTTGGNALKFYASVRMEIRRGKAIKIGDVTIGNKTHIKVIKNKVAAPHQKADFDIIYGIGIHRAGELLDYGVTYGVLDKTRQGHYAFGEQKIGHGRDAVLEFLKDNPDVSNKIEADLKEVMRKAVPIAPAEKSEDEEEVNEEPEAE